MLAQVDGLSYVDGPVTMMNVRVDRHRAPVADVRSPFSIKPDVLNEQGQPIGGLLLWLDDDGYIDCVEYYWFTDEMPTVLPTPAQLREWKKQDEHAQRSNERPGPE